MEIFTFIIGGVFGSILTLALVIFYLRYKMKKMMKSMPNLGDIFCTEDEK